MKNLIFAILLCVTLGALSGCGTTVIHRGGAPNVQIHQNVHQQVKQEVNQKVRQNGAAQEKDNKVTKVTYKTSDVQNIQVHQNVHQQVKQQVNQQVHQNAGQKETAQKDPGQEGKAAHGASEAKKADKKDKA